MKMKAFVFQAHIKQHTHTNPDGTKIEIRAIDIGERTFWDELTKSWIKSEEKGRKINPTEYEIELKDEDVLFRRVCDPVTFVELYTEHYDKVQQKLVRITRPENNLPD